jgi:hypothetical protein
LIIEDEIGADVVKELKITKFQLKILGLLVTSFDHEKFVPHKRNKNKILRETRQSENFRFAQGGSEPKTGVAGGNLDIVNMPIFHFVSNI